MIGEPELELLTALHRLLSSAAAFIKKYVESKREQIEMWKQQDG